METTTLLSGCQCHTDRMLLTLVLLVAAVAVATATPLAARSAAQTNNTSNSNNSSDRSNQGHCTDMQYKIYRTRAAKCRIDQKRKEGLYCNNTLDLFRCVEAAGSTVTCDVSLMEEMHKKAYVVQEGLVAPLLGEDIPGRTNNDFSLHLPPISKLSLSIEECPEEVNKFGTIEDILYTDSAKVKQMRTQRRLKVSETIVALERYALRKQTIAHNRPTRRKSRRSTARGARRPASASSWRP